MEKSVGVFDLTYPYPSAKMLNMKMQMFFLLVPLQSHNQRHAGLFEGHFRWIFKNHNAQV